MGDADHAAVEHDPERLMTVTGVEVTGVEVRISAALTVDTNPQSCDGADHVGRLISDARR